jgi:hypothetical protein
MIAIVVGTAGIRKKSDQMIAIVVGIAGIRKKKCPNDTNDSNNG